MKKITAILFVLVLALSVCLTGCTGDGDDTGDNGEAEKMVVGFIYVGSVGDGGYTYAHEQGRLYLEEQLGDQVTTLKQESVAENMNDVTTAARNMIDQGAKVIFTTSYGFMDPTAALAEEYPEVVFMHFSGSAMNDTNFGNYFGAMEEPRYLSGIVAGMKTQSNSIGYVAAFDYTELLIGINAFTLGVQSVNPEATVTVVWTNAWEDAAKEKAAAEALLEAGCDIIAQHVDTTGPQIAAQEVGCWSLGYNSDASTAAPEAFMTAPVWNHGVYVTEQVQKVMDGTWTPESYYGTLKDGYVDLLPLTAVAPEGAQAKVDEVRAQIESGELNVFTGPIKNQAGEIVVPEGESLDRAAIWQMDYLVEGVTEKVQ